MNEVSNFCNKDGTGQICENSQPETCQEMSYQCCLVCKSVDLTNTYDFPPYNINNFYGLISSKTLQMSTKQYNNTLVYNTHNLYGLTEQIATNNAIKTITGKRPFLLTRSSFLTTGQHSFKWSGDNVATWYSLKSSIISIMDFNLFSIPMIGSDICGFIKDTNEELCTRWIEVGAFYPFTRDHNDKGYLSQELYRWNSTTVAAKKALAMKYQLLPYYYSLFHQANTVGTPVIQSLWMNFPADVNCSNIDEQFMVGDSVLVSPVLEKYHRAVQAYFPKGLWYDFQSKSLLMNSAGESKTLKTGLTDIQVHIRGGSILPLQDSAMTTTLSRQTPFTYLVAFNEENTAEGSLFWDDGEQLELKEFLTVQMKASYDAEASRGDFVAQSTRNTWGKGVENYKVGKIILMNPNGQLPKVVFINKRRVDRDSVTFNILSKTITIENINIPLSSHLELTWE
jgi:alpha-D-xyloside xylohydrolase